jgi:hypothetical protein
MNEADKEAFEERAAIMEYDGKLSRRIAEQLARASLQKAAPPLPPEKQGKHYTEFREYWRSRQIR